MHPTTWRLVRSIARLVGIVGGTYPLRNGLSMKSVRASSLTSIVMAMGMKTRVKDCIKM